MNSNEKQVCSYIDKKSGDLIAFLQQLVSKESINPPGNTTGPAKLIEEKLKTYGIDCEKVTVGDIHQSIIATLGEGGKNLLFNAHIDTVPVGNPAQWTVDPFNEPIHGRILYGRGCADDKGGVAAMVMAMCALKKCGIELKGRMTINPVADEETGGNDGVKFLLENGYLAPDLVVVGEITENNVAVVHKGLIWFEIISKGKTAHASTPWDGVNAINKMVKFLDRMKRYYEEELPKHIDPLTPPATYSIGTIEGGVKANVVPDRCTVVIDRRILAEETLEEAESELQRIIDLEKKEDPESDISFKVINYSPSLRTDPKEVLVEEALKVVSIWGGDAEPVGYQQSSDGRYFSKMGIPTVLIGPGVASVGHAPDESICLDDVISCAKIYAILTMRLLGYTEMSK